MFTSLLDTIFTGSQITTANFLMCTGLALVHV